MFLSSDLISCYCMREDLSTHDPYDIWKIDSGVRVKALFNQNRLAGFLPAVLFYLTDTLVPGLVRQVAPAQEYPVVRALACLALFNLFRRVKDPDCLSYARIHLDWLEENSCRGYSGYCWGLNFNWASKNGLYGANTPLNSMTPYVLEAFLAYRALTLSGRYDHVIEGILSYFEKDCIILHQDDSHLAFAYAPTYDARIVVNINSYLMHSHAQLAIHFPNKRAELIQKAAKLYAFVVSHQNRDGSWFYFTDRQKGNFIDCFHTCIVLKNLIKLGRMPCGILVDPWVIQKGVSYLEKAFCDRAAGLYKRFSVQDIPSTTRFDLYDNAEMLNLFHLTGHVEAYHLLNSRIQKAFFDPKNRQVFSKIDVFGRRLNPDHLRWAVMPYIYAVSLRG